MSERFIPAFKVNEDDVAVWNIWDNQLNKRVHTIRFEDVNGGALVALLRSINESM